MLAKIENFCMIMYLMFEQGFTYKSACSRVKGLREKEDD